MCARLLIIDFSSAFNTIQSHLLIDILISQFNIDLNVAGWILDFFNRKITVCSSQRCIFYTVILYTCICMYTNYCHSFYKDRHIIKYPDDSVIVSLLQDQDRGQGPVVDDFVV